MMAHEIVPERHNESSVTKLSRAMVCDYMRAKDRMRNSTPDLGNRRVRFQNYRSSKKASPKK